jgi:hypothetical protein
MNLQREKNIKRIVGLDNQKRNRKKQIYKNNSIKRLYKEEKMRRVITFIGIILLSIAAIFISMGCAQELDLGDVDRSEIEIVFEDTVITGDIKWELLEAEDLGPSITDEYEATFESREGRLIFLSFAVTNMGEDVRQIFDIKVVDDNGDYYSVCTEAYAYFSAPAVCTIQDAIPDVRQEFNASFDVPLDSVDLILEVTDLRIPPAEKKYIDLGL